MVITFASFKGGVGKSTSAMHVAHFINEIAPTMLVDSDPNKSVTRWAARNPKPYFHVGTPAALAKDARHYEHFVMDTPARPENLDLEGVLEHTDFLVIPTQPASLALDTLQDAVELFRAKGSNAVRVLLTEVPPAPQKDGVQAREALIELGFDVMKAQVRKAKAFEFAARRGILVREVTGDPLAWLAMSDYEAVAAELVAAYAALTPNTGQDTSANGANV